METAKQCFDTFISYNSVNSQVAQDIASYLRAHGLNVWLDDSHLPPGAKWLEEIHTAIRSSASALVLVGKEGLGPWEQSEMALFLSEAATRGMWVIPVLLNGGPSPDKLPLGLLERTVVDLRGGVTENGLQTLLSGITEGNVDKVIHRPQSVDRDKNRVWFPQPWPVTTNPLFGRDEELAFLHHAWKEGRINVLSVIAWAGAGKTALINDWLFRTMEAHNWYDADKVFGWSFYRQGCTEGQQASADTFINEALTWFGDRAYAESSLSIRDKGSRLANLVQQCRTLLVLDGLEPLQEPPGSSFPGKLKDPGLAALLTNLACSNQGLCLITSRVHVANLCQHSTAVSRDLGDLALSAAVQCLREQGVTVGSDMDLQIAANEYRCHALALTLLGRYIHDALDGNIHRRNEIAGGELLSQPRDPQHAQRVMFNYETWYKNKLEGEILRNLGLFDRPVDWHVIEEVLFHPPIASLTTLLSKARRREINRALNTLREACLLSSTRDPKVLDAHPLVRQFFAGRLAVDNPAAWTEAHKRLFYHYSHAAKKKFPVTTEEMNPLYLAVGHGCQAGLYREALNDVYIERIQRGDEAYGRNRLGAVGSSLSVLGGFFIEPWCRPVESLGTHDRAVVLAEVGYSLRALGRLPDAITPLRNAHDMYVAGEEWTEAAITASILRGLHLVIGDIDTSLEYSQYAVCHSRRSSNSFAEICAQETVADVHHQAGRLQQAMQSFPSPDRMRESLPSGSSVRYWLPGYRYCDYLLDLGHYDEVLDWGCEMLASAEKLHYLLHMGLDRSLLARATLLRYFNSPDSAQIKEASRDIDDAVTCVRKAGRQDYLPLILLSRAKIRRIMQVPEKATQDLQEAFDIAASGGMHLWETDVHLECAQLLLDATRCRWSNTQSWFSDTSPLWLVKPKEDTTGQAREHLRRASEWVDKLDYRRREPELLLTRAKLEHVQNQKSLARDTLREAHEYITRNGYLGIQPEIQKAIAEL